jgi:hypothetical protein
MLVWGKQGVLESRKDGADISNIYVNGGEINLREKHTKRHNIGREKYEKIVNDAFLSRKYWHS